MVTTTTVKAGHERLPEGIVMRRVHPVEISAVAGILMAGIAMFVWTIVKADAIPAEFRSASPGYGWSWDFDYETAMREAGRMGAQPWPWPATQTGNRLVLPLNQPLLFHGHTMTYQGMNASGGFRLDIVFRSLDASVSYPHAFSVSEARQGLMIAERRFRLEKITPRYLRLRAVTGEGYGNG